MWASITVQLLELFLNKNNPMIVFLADIESVSVPLNLGYVTDLSSYGGSNPARNTLALFVYLYKRAADNTDIQITIDNSLPLTATQWAFTLPAQDGNFVAIIFGFDIWQAGTYNNLNCVYYAGSYYVANTTTSQTPGTGGNWTLITDILATCTGNASVEQTQIYMWSSARAEAGVIGDTLADLSEKIRDGRCSSWSDAGAALTGAAMINGAFANFRRGDYVNAQKDMDFIDQQTAATL